MKTMSSATTWCAQLHHKIVKTFDSEGVDLLCFVLDIAYENLPGPNWETKALSLIEFMEGQQQLSELINACQRLRPNTSWNHIRALLPEPTAPIPLSERFSLSLYPNTLENAGVCEIIINNEGIQRTSYTIVGDDPDGVLNLTNGQERQKIVAPGKAAKINLCVTPKKRPLVGRPRNHTFTIQVSTSAKNQKSVVGHLTVKPIMPSWVATLFSLLTF